MNFWAIKYPINLVTTANSWFLEEIRFLKNELDKLGFSVRIIESHNEIDSEAVVFYLSYVKLVPIEFIKKATVSIVLHASDLPQGKGFSPWVWQILDGINDIHLCLFEMVEELDAGPIVYKETIILNGFELLDEIRKILASSINKLIQKYLTCNERPAAQPQRDENPELIYRRRISSDSELDINKSILQQFNLLRVVDNDNYPAFFIHKDNKYLIKIEKESK